MEKEKISCGWQKKDAPKVVKLLEDIIKEVEAIEPGDRTPLENSILERAKEFQIKI